MTRSPPEIYAIGLDDNGKAIVKVALNKDYIDNVIWDTKEVLGNAVDCVIEFDGDWKKDVGEYRFITEQEPWVFWIDNNNVLWGQHLLENSSKIELSNGALKLTAIKGYRNIVFTERDHGLVVMYIKNDGFVYYRSRINDDGNYVWENERVIEEFTGTAIDVESFRTNDYRVGFIIKDITGSSTVLMTSRNWAGIALSTEYLSIAPLEVTATLIPVEFPKGYLTEYLSVTPMEIVAQLLFADTNNEILIAENIPITKLDENQQEYDDWGWVIELKVQNPIPILVIGNITVTDIAKSAPIQMASVTKVDDFTFRLLASGIVENGFNDVLGDIRIGITNVVNEAGYNYENMAYMFTPINLDPSYIPIPEVEVIWNE